MSAIEEYYLHRGNSTKPSNNDCKISNKDLHELLLRMRYEQDSHLQQQDYLLQIIQNQSKPQFGREFLANISANAAWDGLLFIGSKLLKRL